jgi:hypothetical protein
MIKTSYRSDSYCSYSNYQFNWNNPLVRKVEVERKTPKMKLAYKAESGLSKVRKTSAPQASSEHLKHLVDAQA